ncbi:hypothetical protein REJ49_002391, partial [Citrobacter farmeri]|nr:hypothetical protein [Citrobacter farmeri]
MFDELGIKSVEVKIVKEQRSQIATMTRLKNMIIPGVNLPDRIFHKEFTRYFFFDNDICSSKDLIETIKTIVVKSFDVHFSADVFSSSEFLFLGQLHINEDWVTKLSTLSRKMNDDGDYGGLIIIEQGQRWIVFQKTPVDEGVIGINASKSLETINNLIYENLVDCEVFRKWLKMKSKQDIDLVQTIGKEYLTQLIDNYGAK